MMVIEINTAEQDILLKVIARGAAELVKLRRHMRFIRDRRKDKAQKYTVMLNKA